LTAVKKTIQET